MAARKKNQPPPTIGGDVAAALRERQARSESDEVKLWKARLKFAAEAVEPRYKVYDANEKAVYGESMTEAEKTRARYGRQFTVEINKFLPALAGQRERILPQVPWWNLVPAKAGMSKIELQRMRAAEMCENFVFRSSRMNFNLNASMALMGAELGIGAIDVCFTPDDGEQPEKGKQAEYMKIEVEIDPDTGMEIADTAGYPLLTEDGDTYRRGNKIMADTRDPLDYFDMEYVHWQDLLFDTESGNEPEDLDWVAKKFCMRFDAATENPIFRGTSAENLRRAAKSLVGKTSAKDAIRPPRPYEDGPQSPGDDDFLRVTGWRIQDARKRKVIYLIDGLGELGNKYEYPGWVGHSTLTFLKFNERMGEFLPITSIEGARPALIAYNMFWNTLLNHLKRFKRKYVVAPNAFEKVEQRDQLLDPIDGMTIEARGGKNAVVALEDAYLDPAIYKMMSLAESDFFQQIGSAPEFLGVAQSSSATQASIIDRRGVGREDEKRLLLKSFFERVGDKMLANLQHNLPKELAIRIAGPDGRTWRKVVTRPDIDGHFRNHIDMIEMTPAAESQEIQQDLALIQMVGPQVAFSSEIGRAHV